MPVTGTYTVLVEDFNGPNTGDYTVEVAGKFGPPAPSVR